MEAAIQCGEALWNSSLSMKANGLFDNLTPNITPFLILAQFTKQEKWIMRAYQFAILSFYNKE